MGRAGRLIGAGIVGLVVVALPGQALAKEFCCYRVHVNTSNSVHVEDTGGFAPGAQNGTYDLSSRWAARELLVFNPKGYGDAFFNRVTTRNGREVRGKVKFEGSERSEQWFADGSTNPPTRRDYPPCRYAYDTPWHRVTSAPRVTADRVPAGGSNVFIYFRTYSDVAAAEYAPPGGTCDNTAPFYGHLTGWGFPSSDGTIDTSDGDSYWDALGSSIRVFHTSLRILKPLKKMKDERAVFEPGTISGTSTEGGNPHSFTVTHRTVIRFNWFPRDRLQKEMNELDALKQRAAAR
jgi:hypothetical protein